MVVAVIKVRKNWIYKAWAFGMSTVEDEKAGQDNGKMELFDQPLAAISQTE